MRSDVSSEPRSRKRQSLPTGRSKIETADPIVRGLFIAAHQRKLSTLDLAGLTGRTPTSISRWKHGRSNPSMFDAEILASVLGFKIVLQEKSDGEKDGL